MVSELADAGWMARCVGRGELAPFSAADVAELTHLLGSRDAPAGTTLLPQGEQVEHIGIILRGEVELTHRRRRHREVLQVLHPGDVYGDIPLLCSLPGPFGARAATDVEVIELDETGPETGAVPFSQSTVAGRLGATRPSVTRVLKSFEQAGCVGLSYRRIEVLDPDSLQRIRD